MAQMGPINSLEFGRDLAIPSLVGLHQNKLRRIDELQKHLFALGPRADHAYHMDDFHVLDSGIWTVNSETNPADLAVIVAGLAGGQGVLSAITSTTADEGTAMDSGVQIGLRGTYNPGMAVRFQTSAKHDEFQAEFGFFDAVTASDTDIVTGIDTPTVANGADDVALIAIDTDETIDNFVLASGHNSNGDAVSNMGATMESAKWFTAVVQIDSSGNIHAAVFDENDLIHGNRGSSLVASKGIDPTVSLGLRVFFQGLDTTATTNYVDWVAWWADRA